MAAGPIAYGELRAVNAAKLGYAGSSDPGGVGGQSGTLIIHNPLVAELLQKTG